MMITLFIVITLVLVFLEVLLPGGILGVFAAISLIVATGFGVEAYGFFGGLMVLTGTLVSIILLLFAEFKLLVKMPYGRKFLLNTAIDGRSNQAQAEASIIGKEGVTLTRLNPSGKVSINGKNYEAHSRDGFIENKYEISVVDQDNFKLIVQKL